MEKSNRCQHRWVYAAGICKCSECGYYLQPNGDVTSTPTGRCGKVIEHLEVEPKVVAESGETIIELPNFMALWTESINRRITHQHAVLQHLTEASNSVSTNMRMTTEIASKLIEGKLKPNQDSYDKLAKAIMGDGGMRRWTKGYDTFKLKMPPDRTIVNKNIEAEFVLPAGSMTPASVGLFIEGRETMNSLLHRNVTIELILSPAVIDRCRTPKDIVDTLRSAIEYYDHGLGQVSRSALTKVLQLGPVMKKLMNSTALAGIVTLPMLSLMNLGDITPGPKAFEASPEMTKAADQFITSIAKLPKLNKSGQQEIIASVRKTVRNVTMVPLSAELASTVGQLPKALDDLCSGKLNKRIEIISGKWVMAQLESASVLTEAAKRAKVKRLKKIPADLVSYILIEGEAIRDANDKMLIVSYAYSKLEIVEWYIELIDVQSKRYIVPHTREYLTIVKRDLLAAIKKIMDTPIPKPSDPTITVKYPPGYEG